MAPHFSLALSRREFPGGMIGAVALNGLRVRFSVYAEFSMGSGDGVASD